MLTPSRWALVTGVAMAVVAVVGLAQILLTGKSGAAWVIVGLTAVSSLAAFAVAARGNAPGRGGTSADDPPAAGGAERA